MRVGSLELPFSAISLSPASMSSWASQAQRVDSRELPFSAISPCQLLGPCHLAGIRTSVPSRASSLLDLKVTMSCGLTLQICLIIALSFRCKRWGFGFVNGQVTGMEHGASHTELNTRPHVLKERWREERPSSSSLNFFQAVFTHVVVESS